MEPSAANVRIHPVDLASGVEVWTDVYNAAVAGRPMSPTRLAHSWQQAPAWTAVAARRDHDGVVGVAHVEAPHWTPTCTCAEARIAVATDARGCGIGSTLLAAVSDWARDNGLDGLDVWVEEGDADGLTFLERRGFAEVEREVNSRRDLIEAPDPVVLPDGVVLVTLAQSSDLEEGMYAVAVDAFPDIPSADTVDAGDFDHWHAADLRVPGLIEACSVVALSGDRVVGYAVLVDRDPRPGYAVNEMTAVTRDMRGKGIATAMKRDVIRRAQRAGFTAIETHNEARNDAMLAINRALGYVPVGDSVKLRGPLVH